MVIHRQQNNTLIPGQPVQRASITLKTGIVDLTLGPKLLNTNFHNDEVKIKIDPQARPTKMNLAGNDYGQLSMGQLTPIINKTSANFTVGKPSQNHAERLDEKHRFSLSSAIYVPQSDNLNSYRLKEDKKDEEEARQSHSKSKTPKKICFDQVMDYDTLVKQLNKQLPSRSMQKRYTTRVEKYENKIEQDNVEIRNSYVIDHSREENAEDDVGDKPTSKIRSNTLHPEDKSVVFENRRNSNTKNSAMKGLQQVIHGSSNPTVSNRGPSLVHDAKQSRMAFMVRDINASRSNDKNGPLRNNMETRRFSRDISNPKPDLSGLKKRMRQGGMTDHLRVMVPEHKQKSVEADINEHSMSPKIRNYGDSPTLSRSRLPYNDSQQSPLSPNRPISPIAREELTTQPTLVRQPNRHRTMGAPTIKIDRIDSQFPGQGGTIDEADGFTTSSNQNRNAQPSNSASKISTSYKNTNPYHNFIRRQKELIQGDLQAMIQKYKSNTKILWNGPDEAFCDAEQHLKIGFKMGEGSFASVYEGYDKILKMNVAIKVFEKSKVQMCSRRVELIEKELEILAKLPAHENVCEFYRLVEDKKKVDILLLSSISLWSSADPKQ
jgi:hypothetical protein